MGIYALKPGFQRVLDPVVAGLVTRGTSPNAVTTAGVGFAVAAGAAIAVSRSVPALLFLVPIAVVARLAANAIDGQVARAGGLGGRPTGMLWNEIGDRVGDVAVFAAFAALPGVPVPLVFAAVVTMLLSSSLGVLGAAVGGARSYVGVMAKPDRMVLVAIAAPLVFWFGPVVATGALWVVLVGGMATFAQRWSDIARGGGSDA